MIGAVEREQAGFERNESGRMGRADRATHDAAGIGVQAAGNIQCEYRGAQVVDRGDPLGITTADIALETDAENPIHDQSPLPRGGQGGDDGAAGLTPGGQRGPGVGRKLLLVAGVGHRDLEIPFLEMPCHDERVAAVVAGARQHQHGLAGAAGDVACDLGRGKPGFFHQLRRILSGGGRRLDGANAGGQVNRRAVSGVYHHKYV
ncbi:hypothetical protein D3C83_10000 [compost metagenome]